MYPRSACVKTHAASVCIPTAVLLQRRFLPTRCEVHSIPPVLPRCPPLMLVSVRLRLRLRLGLRHLGGYRGYKMYLAARG